MKGAVVNFHLIPYTSLMAKQKASAPSIVFNGRQYKLKRPGTLVKKGLQVDDALYSELKRIASRNNLRSYQALDFAIQDFVRRHDSGRDT